MIDIKPKLQEIFNTLDIELGDTDPCVDGMTDDEIMYEYPIFWAAKELSIILSDMPPLYKENARLRSVVKRLASMEALTVAFAANIHSLEYKELRARMEYADAEVNRWIDDAKEGG